MGYVVQIRTLDKKNDPKTIYYLRRDEKQSSSKHLY